MIMKYKRIFKIILWIIYLSPLVIGLWLSITLSHSSKNQAAAPATDAEMPYIEPSD